MTQKDLHLTLRTIMEERGLSMTAVARGIGLSTATISQWLNHSYRGNVAKIEESVRKFIELQQERKARQDNDLQDPGFIKTSVAAKVFEVAKICHIDGDIGVVVGDSGLGKTTAAKEFTTANAGVILLEADKKMPVKACFSKLQKALGGDGYGTAYNLFDDVVTRLRASGRLLIIDEAEHLPYETLELLRRVHDKAGVGILLIGTPVLLGNLRGLRGQFTQLYSRVGVLASLNPLRAQDSEAIVHAALPGSNGIWKFFHEKTLGNCRKLCKLIKRSARVAEINQSAITEDVITAAMQTLMI